jgi:hypothetical protein
MSMTSGLRSRRCLPWAQSVDQALLRPVTASLKILQDIRSAWSTVVRCQTRDSPGSRPLIATTRSLIDTNGIAIPSVCEYHSYMEVLVYGREVVQG